MNNKQITDHSLQLLVDNQLDEISRVKLIKQIDKSPDLQQKLKQLTELKELIGLAYIQELPRRSVTDRKSSFDPSFFVALAASLIMALGLTLGWFAHQQYGPQQIDVAKAETTTETIRQRTPIDLTSENDRKFIMHFDSLNENRLQAALYETSSIIESYANSDLPVKIDLLFDQESVHMFKPQHASQVQHLKALINKHDNIDFYACSKSLRMFLNADEISEDISIFHSDQIVQDMIPERIKQGWVYIKI